jgi:DNA-nicking Smr family endonuclease
MGKRSAKTPPKPSAVTDADRILFREAIGKVRSVSHDKVPVEPARPPPRLQQRTHEDPQRPVDGLSDEYDTEPWETSDELLYARADLPRRTLTKLRRGQFSFAGALDLHGMTVIVARQALGEFLHHCQLHDWRCIRIVHGKGNRSRQGRPVLKNKVAHWLRQCDEVLAYCSARPADGGTGAVYVLLKSGQRK